MNLDSLLRSIPVSVYLAGFVLLWFGMCYFHAKRSGWSILAKFYKSSEGFNAPRLSWSGNFWLYMRGVSGNTTKVGVNSRGMFLAEILPFALFHPTLFIPWSEIKDQKIEKKAAFGFSFPFIRLTFAKGEDIFIDFGEPVAKYVKQQSSGGWASVSV